MGDYFIIYEENGEYEIEIGKDYGDPVFYPITKELKEKALRSSKDAHEVITFVETGRWPPTQAQQDEITRDFVRMFPELVLINSESKQKLFSKEEYKFLLILAEDEWEEKIQGIVDVTKGDISNVKRLEEEYNLNSSEAKKGWKYI